MYFWITSYFRGQLDDWRVIPASDLPHVMKRDGVDGWKIEHSKRPFKTYEAAKRALDKQGYEF